ncbi:YxiJ family protein [Solibacillus sp. FSL H8-0523]|uniref:YxiJ family protein n=1 Tax=unclassified Solibacillus TaxID=2637870 RepID=UPI00310126C3
MDKIFQQLITIEPELKRPFPTRDIQKIEVDFRIEFLNLPGDVDFYEDFRYYCANIAGTLSYVSMDAEDEIPQGQFDMLFKSFFEFYDQYEFLEGQIEHYPYFFQEYQTFEHARKLLLQQLIVLPKDCELY